jgi:GDP-L-fucose synthase
MKVLIFGGSGFLGSRLVPRLRNRGHEVLAPRSSDIDLTERPSPCGEHRDVDVVIHAAALYGGMPFDIANAHRILATNTRMNTNVFEYCDAISARHLITIGSACAYPGYLDKDFTENDLFTGPLHETVACHGFTKLAMVISHRVYWDSRKLPGTHLLPANLYGPGDVYTIERSHVVAALIRKYTDAMTQGGDVHLMGDGTPIREFLYIDDLADVIVLAAEREPDAVRLLNVGTGIGHSIRELAGIIAAQLGFQGRTHWNPSQPNGTQRKVLVVDRLRATLNPQTPISLEEGIARTLHWYTANKAEADARA